jgi:hypothetical protein
LLTGRPQDRAGLRRSSVNRSQAGCRRSARNRSIDKLSSQPIWP